MSLLLLGLALLLSLLLIPLGFPGTWMMILVGIAHSRLVPGSGIGTVAIVGCVIIALAAELLDVAVTGRYTRKYGGSARGAWGAIVGGLVGAVVGVPVPVVGSLIGAFVGSFAGALVAEFSRGAAHADAVRAATGAAIGRAAAVALKAGAACVMAVWMVAAAI